MSARPAVRSLVVMMGDRRLGTLSQGHGGRLELAYEEVYARDPAATPLSTSIPKAALHYRDRAVRPFLLGLLPDNDQILRRWGERFGVNWRNPFALLAEVGEDVAGAVRFVTPERLAHPPGGSVEWLDDASMERLLRRVRTDPGGWTDSEGDRGRFSLAGAQSKVALLREDGRWGMPGGRLATTQILKVASGQFADQEAVEYATMRAARLVGLVVADVELARFGEEQAVVVGRYDRLREGDGSIERIHQEDLCQALGVMPDRKYEREGGPGAEAAVRLLRQRLGANAPAAVDRFVDALVFNWLVGGTDAHAKNYSLLLYGSAVELAPLYDLTSGLPYRDQRADRDRDSRMTVDRGGLKMAMSISGEAFFAAVRRSEWERFCARNRINLDRVMARIDEISAALPDAVADAANEAQQMVQSGSLATLTDSIAGHVAAMRRGVGLRSGPGPVTDD